MFTYTSYVVIYKYRKVGVSMNKVLPSKIEMEKDMAFSSMRINGPQIESLADTLQDMTANDMLELAKLLKEWGKGK